MTLLIFFAWYIYTHSSSVKSKFHSLGSLHGVSLDEVNHHVLKHFIHLLLSPSCIMICLFTCWDSYYLRVKSMYYSFIVSLS